LCILVWADPLRAFREAVTEFEGIRYCYCGESTDDMDEEYCDDCYSTFGYNEERCAICLENGEGVWVNCGDCECKPNYHLHCFHKCMNSGNRNCPMCREPHNNRIRMKKTE